MNQSDVQLNATYQVKVANNLVPVTITSEHANGGWIGISTKTGKSIRVKNAERLRKRLDDEGSVDPKSQKPSPKKTPSSTREAKDGPSQERKLSLLNAAAMVLKENQQPMNCCEIVAMAVKTGIWHPKAGKTPANTLYTSILREIQNKGDQSRFVKVERGKFQPSSQV